MPTPFPFNLMQSLRVAAMPSRQQQRAKPQRVTKTASVVLNASGNGTATITTPNGVTWDLVSTSVSTTAATTAVPPQCTTYLASAPTPSAYFESTYQGNRAPSDTPHTFLGGEPYTAEWIGGTPGTIATLRIVVWQTEV